MENTGRNTTSDLLILSLTFVAMPALSVRAYRLFTDLGTVLRRKITLRHSMTLVSSKDLFKPVLGSVWH